MARQMALPPLKKGDRGGFEAVADIQILPNPPLSSGEVAEGLLKEELFGCGLGRARSSVVQDLIPSPGVNGYSQISRV